MQKVRGAKVGLTRIVMYNSQAVKQCANLFVSEKNPKDKDGQDAALAQLIADSTEKKFKLNSLFKGMWKKKHYSFDLS